jgi:hypothetical protein
MAGRLERLVPNLWVSVFQLRPDLGHFDFYSYSAMNLTTRIAAVLLLLSLSVTGKALAQIEQDTTHWNDEDLYKEEPSSPAFFSVGGGVLGGLLMPNLDDFNKYFAQPFAHSNLDNKVWMIGGQGFVTLPWVKNLRVGGLGMSGTSDCGCGEDTVNGAAVGRFLEYEVGYGALTIDYVLPLRTGRFHIVPGVALGLGSVNVYARQAQSRDFDIGADFNSATVNTTHTYTSSFFLYMPQIQFEYSPMGYLMFRVGAGYQGTSMGDWKVDRDVKLTNTTNLANVNGSGLIIHAGVFFGLFQ